ncbi:MAG: sigma-70 family RNA polymerase sigma factor [Acholeplasmataceae bacterium]
MGKQMKEIIKAFKHKDYTLFDQFYEMTNRQVYYAIIQIVKDDEIAKDLMQEVYMTFLNKIDQFKIDGNVYAYLSMMGRNSSINYYHKQKREVHSDELLDMIESDEGVNEYDDTDDILSLLNLLNKDQREVVVLHTINNLKFKEVAEIMDKPLGTVLWLHREAINILKTKVGDWYEK